MDFGTHNFDNFTTSKAVLTQIASILGSLPDRKVSVWDPFFFNGQVKHYWQELGFDCINEKVDAYDNDSIPKTKQDCIVSAPGFSKTVMMEASNRCLEIFSDTQIPFILILPEHFEKTRDFDWPDEMKYIKLSVPQREIFEDADGDPIKK